MKKNLLYLSLLFSALLSCEKEKDDNTEVCDLNTRHITALAIDDMNRRWVGTDTGLFKSVTTGYELIDIKLDGAVTSLAFDDVNKVLWVGTGQGIAKITASGNWNEADTIPLEKMSNKAINSIYPDSNSDTWFGTAKGITLNRSDIWQKELFKKNLSGTITALTFEKYGVNSIACWDGDCYFATNGKSVYRTFNWDETADAFSGASQLLYPYNGEALTDTMHVVFIDSKGQQWFGGQEGLQLHVGHDPKMDNTSFLDELASPVVRCIAEANDGKIWVGTEGGISVYNGSSWVDKTASLPDPFVTAIAFEKDGKVWIGTKKGLVTID